MTQRLNIQNVCLPTVYGLKTNSGLMGHPTPEVNGEELISFQFQFLCVAEYFILMF